MLGLEMMYTEYHCHHFYITSQDLSPCHLASSHICQVFTPSRPIPHSPPSTSMEKSRNNTRARPMVRIADVVGCGWHPVRIIPPGRRVAG
ncbi:hypothetical protein BU24DRAFT_270835 [Aaosphaeria arxii CBS 175.79]|uniref:Uncharacterized protein n=1 Tax=Aaosphaeria arxii CBS 175.79 TaxID=1450172 RepID=A0A6A5XH67_9PLEO|nr:uncharacterized protein BU24DRAFT_270835 [Aaosphaeria arxii CBS 175.79]KAF2012141.1 hypothetical protein BU24DRAFT_270835 [Aaosphaeria arxii CBS 175.79]